MMAKNNNNPYATTFMWSKENYFIKGYTSVKTIILISYQLQEFSIAAISDLI